MSAPASDTPLPLAAEFPQATHGQWLALVDKVLKGRPLETLHTRARDGFAIEPLYAGRPDAVPLARATAGAWQVLQRVDQPDAAAANAQALQDLENGATGLMLVFAGAAGAHGFGLPATADTVARALEGVYLNGAAIELDLGDDPAAAVGAVEAAVAASGTAPADTAIRFALDPLGAASRAGTFRRPWTEEARALAAAVVRSRENGFRGSFAVADGRAVHDAGGSEAQELAFVLAAAVAYLRALEAGGLPLADVRDALFFRVAVDAEQFMTMAKLRALRLLWAEVQHACGLDPAPAFISAETAWRMMTQRDPYVNMLRAAIATTAAGLGGADAVAVLPFTAARGLPNEFARRVARNTQLVLIEEANLHRVADPAAGSGAIEAMTDALAAAAWKLFQGIERAGGAAAALEQGLIQAQVAVTRAAREKDAARGKEVLIGTSAFPHLGEADVAVLAVPPAAQPKHTPAFAALAPHRLAKPWETLRDRSDQVLAQTGTRPRVFLATLGSATEHGARVMFAQNFFAAGGIEAEVAVGADAGFQARAAEFTASGAPLACICGTDAAYADAAALLARALREAGAAEIYQAGRPGETEAALREAGVGTFIFAGGDALSVLRAAHDILDTCKRTRES